MCNTSVVGYVQYRSLGATQAPIRRVNINSIGCSHEIVVEGILSPQIKASQSPNQPSMSWDIRLRTYGVLGPSKYPPIILIKRRKKADCAARVRVRVRVSINQVLQARTDKKKPS